MSILEDALELELISDETYKSLKSSTTLPTKLIDLVLQVKKDRKNRV